MNQQLLVVTKNEILERQMLEVDSLFDSTIFRAIEKYLQCESIQEKAYSFIKEMSPIWMQYEKEKYIEVFKKYIDIETGVEVFTNKHISHLNHVIQEFLVGYNIIMSASFIKTKYNYKESRLSFDSEFYDLLFSWMVAALFHDIGYDVEEYKNEEEYRSKKNEYWSFINSRPVLDRDMTIDVNNPIINILDQDFIPQLNKIFDKKFTLLSFINIFKIQNGNQFKYDHALISAIKYYDELYKLQEKNGGRYLEWQPNINAIIAILMHNIKHKEQKFFFDTNNANFIPTVLLLICDEIEYWERSRVIKNTEMENYSVIDLMGASFKENYSYFIVNHNVSSNVDKYKQNIIEKYYKGLKKYPVTISFSTILNEVNKEIQNKTVDTFNRAAMAYLFNIDKNIVQIASDNIVDIIKLNSKKKTYENIINDLVSHEKLFNNNYGYRLIVEHRINDMSFIFVTFCL